MPIIISMGMSLSPKTYRVNSNDDWTNSPGKSPLSRAIRIFHHNDTRQTTIIENMENIPEDIPPAHVSHVYGKEKGKWVFIGYKCLKCGRPLAKQISVQQHPLVCNNNKKINKEMEGDFMPIQAVTVKGERYYRWGTHGKLYKNRSDAEKQAQAAHASGYQEPTQSPERGRPQVAPKVKK